MVVAACSPHMHEKTFRRACANAGLNPFLLQMANIREHVSWSPRTARRPPTRPSAVVSGGGAARGAPPAARAAARCRSTRPRWWWAAASPASRPRWSWPTPAIRSTWSSASRPSAGTWPSSTRPSRPWTARPASSRRGWSEVGQHENVTLMTYGRSRRSTGYVGNFHVRVRKKARFVNENTVHGLRGVHREVPAEPGGRRLRGRPGLPQGHLPTLSPGRAQVPGHRQGRLHLLPARQVPGLRDLLRAQRRSTSSSRTRSSRSRSATSSWPPATSCSTPAAAPVRLRAAGQRLHQPGVRADGQRGRAHQRQDRAARRRDRAQERGHRPLRRQPRQELPTSTARRSAACTRSSSATW